MSNYTPSRTVTGDIVVWITILGFLYGIWAGTYAWTRQKTIQRLGSTCYDKEQMGPFVARFSRWWQRVFLFIFPIPCKVPVPHLPTITALIKAGDDGLYTSALFDGIEANYQQVSWKPLYEAFFHELLWRQWTQSNKNQDVDQYLHSTSLHFCKLTKGVLNDLDQAAGRQWRLTLKWNSVRALFASPTRKTVTGAFLCRDSTKIDRHLLYQKDTRFESRVALSPVLVSCIRELKIVGQARPELPAVLTDDRTKCWNKLNQDLWIHAGCPCVEVSEQEIAAFAICLGMPIQVPVPGYMPNGVGAFGTCLSSDKIDCVSSIRLIYGHRSYRHQPSMGSGYTTLFAKHLACSCLPFAQTSKWKQVETIAIDKIILEALKRGETIVDVPVNHWSLGMSYLDRLPSAATNSYYCGSSSQGRLGDIRDHYDEHVGTWWRAVAGIAFGGLVPMAANPLVEAVQFTVLGGLPTSKEVHRGLENLINRLHEKLYLEIPSVFLFSKRQELVSEKLTAGYPLDMDPDESEIGLREYATIFGRYMTLLERLTAIIQDPEGDPCKRVFRRTCHHVKKSYRAAVWTHHRRHHLRGIPAEAISDDEDADEHSESQQIESSEAILARIPDLVESNSLNSNHCGQVARCIIEAWTCHVRRIRWSDDGEDTGGQSEISAAEVDVEGALIESALESVLGSAVTYTIAKADSTGSMAKLKDTESNPKEYQLPSLLSLPDVAALR